jgi:hypothetical protein
MEKDYPLRGEAHALSARTDKTVTAVGTIGVGVVGPLFLLPWQGQFNALSQFKLGVASANILIPAFPSFIYLGFSLLAQSVH